ncbi:phosphodiesterase [Fodinicola acaciae]|uniref:phosphodiesterase n=1 Tax=Fodinicola acaciae TaxID=2681555 RepID=UPI0013D6C65D|nr:phosphodiesterase [Fodinicola acaciae]
MTLIAHLSDPHLTVGPAGDGPEAGLRTALRTVAAYAPDAVVITGDLVDNGQVAEYERLRPLLAGLPWPVHLVLGNHDDRAAARQVFSLPGEGFVQYAVDIRDTRLVVLDSLIPGSAAGELSADRLAWLDSTLAERPDTPTLVALHHPPMATGIAGMDAIGLTAPGFAEVLAAHPHVVRVLTGHIHRSVSARFGGTTVTVSPSTARQVTLDLTGATEVTFRSEPPGFLLHFFDGPDPVTHLVPVGDHGPTWTMPDVQ